MLVYYLWKDGLLRRIDREKLLFFLGQSGSAMVLSRRWPLLTAFNWPKALFSPRYARSLTTWLGYRVALFDGGSG